MRNIKSIFVLAISLIVITACSHDEDDSAYMETQRKTAELREQFASKMVGTWYMEHISDKHKYFELLELKDDGTMTGKRRWLSRDLVKIEGEEKYTDWEEVVEMNGSFVGTWDLRWEDENYSTGNHNRLFLYANWNQYGGKTSLAYSHNIAFLMTILDELRLYSIPFPDSDGYTTYHRGEKEPSF